MSSSQNTVHSPVSLGVVPLTDCAPIVAAYELGVFEAHGLDVSISVEQAWSSIRDKVAYGVLDGAMMIAPITLATTLGVGGVSASLVAPMTLSLNGNAITISSAIAHEIEQIAGEECDWKPPVYAGWLRRVIEQRKATGQRPLTFGVVYPVSTHDYELRYWLSEASIDPAKDVRIVVVPPAQMIEQLERGAIDGYCVGEPWNALAAQRGVGKTLITKHHLWRNSPEKMLGMNASWVEANPEATHSLLCALLETCVWLDDPQNHAHAASILSDERYTGVDASVIEQSFGSDSETGHVFSRYCANFPWHSHGLWFLVQMLRWGQIEHAFDLRKTVKSVYRVDLFRKAARAMGTVCPAVDDKIEGAHDAPWRLDTADGAIEMGQDNFFDGEVFDPASPIDYLRSLNVTHAAVSPDDLTCVNL